LWQRGCPPVKEQIMKTLLKVGALIAAFVAAPIVSFAQQSQPLTRAQVRADLVAVEKAGYNPSDDLHYPENIQRAERIIAEQNAAAQSQAAR
jgi:hypothetical protein